MGPSPSKARRLAAALQSKCEMLMEQLLQQVLAQPLAALGIVGAVLFAMLLWLVLDMRARWMRIFGKRAPIEGKLLEELLHRIAKSETRLDLLGPRVDVLERIGKISVQKVGFLRFNPFADTGGDQSFSLALLDRDNNGVVLSSLYIREGTRLYAKEIVKGEARQPLSNEEKRVLEEAVTGNPKF